MLVLPSFEATPINGRDNQAGPAHDTRTSLTVRIGCFQSVVIARGATTTGSALWLSSMTGRPLRPADA